MAKKIDPLEAVRGMIGDTPTSSDNSGQAPTKADIVRQSPTSADDRELVRTTVRLARWQREQLQARADTEGRLLSDVIRDAVRQYLNRG